MPFAFGILGLGVLAAETFLERLSLLWGGNVSPDANDSSKSGNLKDSARFGEMDHGRSELVEVMILVAKPAQWAYDLVSVRYHLYLCFVPRREF